MSTIECQLALTGLEMEWTCGENLLLQQSPKILKKSIYNLLKESYKQNVKRAITLHPSPKGNKIKLVN